MAVAAVQDRAVGLPRGQSPERPVLCLVLHSPMANASASPSGTGPRAAVPLPFAPAPEAGPPRWRWCFSLCDLFAWKSMIKEPLEMVGKALRNDCSWHLGFGAAPCWHSSAGTVQVVGQEAGVGWEWMCSSIFSRLQNNSSSNLAGQLLQGRKCLPGDMSLEGSWRVIS